MSRFRVSAGLALALAGATAAFAQADYPSRTVTIVSPVATGGTYSAAARIIGAKLEERLRQPFVIENRQGAGTVLGTNSVAKAAPDGYTLLVAGNPALAINATVSKSLPYDPVADFAPIYFVGRTPQVLVVNAALPIRSVAEIVRYAKDNPGKLNYASTGAGTVLHLQGELLKGELKLDITHVPYRGASPALSDVAAGHVSMMFVGHSVARGMIDAGKVRAIGISTKERDDNLKGIPPLAETGLPGFDLALWYMLLAPARTPQPVVDRLHAEVEAIYGDAAVRSQLVSQGITPGRSMKPDALRAYIRSEIAFWGAIAKKAGVAGIL
ncbi:MAG: tripartite tricarboxylate transporter substrate binding protein [Alphaproteobacteria bacterium]|nr:tripartite tricarboxylate transporter substrate binding protein [Alphaproteobacteria bacterium]